MGSTENPEDKGGRGRAALIPPAPGLCVSDAPALGFLAEGLFWWKQQSQEWLGFVLIQTQTLARKFAGLRQLGGG